MLWPRVDKDEPSANTLRLHLHTPLVVVEGGAALVGLESRQLYQADNTENSLVRCGPESSGNTKCDNKDMIEQRI